MADNDRRAGRHGFHRGAAVAAGAERGEIAAAGAGDARPRYRPGTTSVLPRMPKLTVEHFAALGENGVAQKGVLGAFRVEGAEEDDGQHGWHAG